MSGNSYNSAETADTAPRRRASFAEDFRRFFIYGLAAVLPTLITLWLLLWVWDFLWASLGSNLIWVVKWTWLELVQTGILKFQPPAYIGRYWDPELYPIRTHIVGVGLAILLVYFVGVLAGNLIGRTAWGLVERGAMRIPLVRAIYPAVKQVTDFVLQERSQQHLRGSRVVAVQPHAQGIWSIGMVTGRSHWPLKERGTQEMVSVFIPSTPTAFTGYVLVVPRSQVVELPMSVEEALRMLVSGGVITPPSRPIELSDDVPQPAKIGPIEHSGAAQLPPMAQAG
ncbi:MAG TPA: DUF502 domain-containing protein [Tepidisphaeraceae bacterium]|nr:DUF502 domain-containing protein [Tepidisphaeraceae bacterium]